MDIEQLAGTKLGNYQIESLLGRGGMGVVYKARQISLNRPVALKILSPNLGSDASFVKRFQREAEAVAQLDHSNIVQIFDTAKAKGLHFFSMQYVEGRTLNEVLKEKGCLDANEAFKIITQAAQGIEHAHKNGIIHRDIKPSNIILDDSGNAKVMDFGLARLAGKTRLTETATVMGTVAYMSPEQARGDSAIDHRTDIWSLGVVLYEMLTGVLPFDAETDTGLIYKIVHEDPEPIRNHRSDIPDSLALIVEKTIQKDPPTRYERTEELIADLEVVKSRVSVSIETRSPSIAVLPFVNMSADPEQEYFCDGLSEELINALTQIKDLKVIARTSAFSFKGKDVKIRDIGKELDVGAVLEGSVRKAGNRLRITAQLVETRDSHHLWSEKYDRELDDIFAIQDEITETIIDKLKPKLLGEEKAKLAKRQTVDLEAYNLYLKGLYFLGKITEEGVNKAIQYFEQALGKSPEYALAYAGLAISYCGLPFCSPTPPKKAFPEARKAALKALAIDDTLAEAHTSLAITKMFYEWDWEGSEREYQLAIDLNPGYPTAHHEYAVLLTVMSRFDEAIEEIDRAIELDPLSLIINTDRGAIFNLNQQYDKAIEVFQKAIEIDPSFPYVHAQLGLAYLGKSMYEEALAEIQKGRTLSGGLDYLAEAFAGYGYALMGKKDEAQQMLDNLLERSRKVYVAPYFLAGLFFALGETETGFDWLDRAYEERDPWLFSIKKNPFLNILDLRSDPRYTSLLKKMNLEP